LNLLFRDYLRSNSDARNEYAATKVRILQDETSQQKIGKISLPIYTLRKGKFINGILQKIGFNRLRVLKSTTDDEWIAVKNFRQKCFFDNQKIQDPYTWTFEHKDHEHFVMYHGVEIIGYAHIQLWPESRAALRILVLSEQNRNLGFGSWFLSIIEEWLKVHDYKSIHVLSNEKALNFYKKHRYVDVPFNDPHEYKNDPQDIAVEKIL
jgi:GNAT superfamily N-acetyltransferase